MRKASFFATSCIAVVAFLGLSSQAMALTDPDCDGTPYDNTPAIHEFTLATPDSPFHFEVSGLTGGALVCGSDIKSLGRGSETLYDHADLAAPPGVVYNDTSGIATGSYTGSATVSVLYHLFGFPNYDSGVNSTLRVDPITNCANEPVVGGHIAGTIVACTKGENILGHNWNWTTLDNFGKYWITIGPQHGIGNITNPGLTRVSLSLCGYAGSPSGSSCGSNSEPFLQKNGEGEWSGACEGGNGIYTATATRKDGVVTPAVTTCVPWTPHYVGEDCNPHQPYGSPKGSPGPPKYCILFKKRHHG